VKNKTGEPVPQATIQQKGTNTIVKASDEGVFSIEVNGNNVVLIVSSSGFESGSFNVGAGSTLDAALEARTVLAEVVVTALGINRKQKSLGYSTQQVAGKDLTLTKEQNVLVLLQGKLLVYRWLAHPEQVLGVLKK
jgi:hypothetical protein